MSAWNVSDKHINSILSWGINNEVFLHIYKTVLTAENALKFARILRKENQHSITCRYGNPDVLDPIKFNLVDLDECGFNCVTILKLCDCYVYQACESDDYKESRAISIVNCIRAAIITEMSSELAGWNEAPWGI